MNRFIIDRDPEAIAQQLCDQHICKMVLEEAQMLNTAVRIHAPEFAEEAGLYKIAYENHPCTIWARESSMNYMFGVRLMKAMNDEYVWRYPKRKENGKWVTNTGHKSMRHFDALVDAVEYMPNVSNFMTPHPQCFSGHDDCKTDEEWPIVAYRAFYTLDKSSFARYNRGRDKPFWMNGDTEIKNLRVIV